MKIFNFVLLASMVAVSSCDSIKGTGRINKRVQVHKKPNSAEMILVEAGNYNAELSFGKSTSKVTLQNGALKYTIPFVTPRGIQEGIDFDYSSVETGQTFGVRGINKIVTSRSSTSARTESCVLGSHSVPYEYCYPDRRVCVRWERDCRRVDRDRDGHSRRECRDYCAAWAYERGYCEIRYRTEYEYGSQTHYGYTETSQGTLKLDLLEGGSQSGNFTFPKKATSQWITTSSTGCR